MAAPGCSPPWTPLLQRVSLLHLIMGVREPWGSPRQSCRVKTTPPPLLGGFPAWPLCPSEPLELPGTDSLGSQTVCSSYITSSRNNASLCPDWALGRQHQHLRPAAQGASTLYNHLGAPSPAASAPKPHLPWSTEALPSPETGVKGKLECREQNCCSESQTRARVRMSKELSEHTPHFHPKDTCPLER